MRVFSLLLVLVISTLTTGCTGLTVTHRIETAAKELDAQLAKSSEQAYQTVSLQADEDEGFSLDFGDDEATPKEVAEKATKAYAETQATCTCVIDNATAERIAEAVEDKLKPYFEQQQQAMKAAYKEAKASPVSYAAEPVATASVTVDMFTADWCQVCKQVDVAGFPDNVLKPINFDENKGLASSLGVTKLPTFILRNADGKELWRGVGVFGWSYIKTKVENNQSYNAPTYQVPTYNVGPTYAAAKPEVYYHLIDTHRYSASTLDRMTEQQLEELHNREHGTANVRYTYRSPGLTYTVRRR